jgi:hypothetical protein
LAEETGHVIQEIRESRQAAGIDPARLVVLGLTFLDSAEREHLGRLQVQVVHEQEKREPVDPPFYALLVSFATEESLRAFAALRPLPIAGLTGVERTRASSGEADPKVLQLCFQDLQSAKAFVRDHSLQQRLGLQLKSRTPVKQTSHSVFELLVQFPDQASLDRLTREVAAYRGETRAPSDALTNRQRRELFDSLRAIGKLTPQDRRGSRLLTEGVPGDGTDFYLDVDLWHPGTPQLVAEAIRQFEGVVTRAGGRVTDPPSTVAETLLLARVRGSRATLDALLDYDRVARVDLPPKVPEQRFTVLDPVPVPDQLPQLPEDGPVACVVDSGVVSGHPLLRGVVVDERDFDSGENDVVDHVGHGTHVAGIVVYGDTYACLQNNQWAPKVRLLSAKIMRRLEQRAEGGDVLWVCPGFADEERVETQLRQAITTFAQEYGCRIFNLSLGNDACVLGQQRQLPWAYLLDELARSLNVVVVVSAGNVGDPDIPAVTTADEFQRRIRDRILADDGHVLIDPATAVNALSVGAIARTDVPFMVARNPQQRPPLVGSPQECPAPFTRAGSLDGAGQGVRRAVKPEFAWYGGNYCLGLGGGNWHKTDVRLGEPSLRHDFQGTRLLHASCGTSVSAPYVTHVCAVTEAELRRRTPGARAGANLIRALVAHSAAPSTVVTTWLSEGATEPDAERRILRAVGYGTPDADKAVYSSENRVVLIAEDEVQEDYFHLYELDIPSEFVTTAGTRRIRITLAYDPPVRGTRKEYLSRTMWFQVYRGLTSNQILQAMSRAQGTGQPPKLPARNVVKARPPYTLLQWSTLQSASFESPQGRTFDYRAGQAGTALWHVLVGCTSRFAGDPSPNQRYALVVSLEHSDEHIRLYQVIRQRIAQRVRLQIPGT